MTGRLIGLGVGPGDPELLTLKALRILKSARVVAYPAPEAGESFARRIVARWLDGSACEIPIRFPMRPGSPPEEIYAAAAARIAGELDRSADVAFLCEGDPLFYGTFGHLLPRLAGHYPVEIVPGVSSLFACAAATGVALVSRDDSLVVVPATLDEEALARRLAGAENAAIVKLGRHLLKLRRVVERLGLLANTIYVERASLDTERVLPLAAVDGTTAPYFSMALVRRRGQRTESIHS